MVAGLFYNDTLYIWVVAGFILGYTHCIYGWLQVYSRIYTLYIWVVAGVAAAVCTTKCSGLKPENMVVD